MEQQMLEMVPQLAWAIAGAGIGVAAIITAVYNGRAKLLRARRGDPEIPKYIAPIRKLLRNRQR
jgi:hypothetical protein